MGGVNSGFGFGNGNGIFDLAALLIVGGIFGGFGWGGGFGGFGGGAAGLAGTTTAAAETAAMISQQNTADRVAAIGADVRQVLGQTGGIIEAVNTVGNRTQDGFARVDTNLCQLGHAQTMQSMNNYNGLTNQLTEMRFANAQCCCDTKQMFQSGLCDLRHLMDTYKCDTDSKIAASTATILAQLNSDKFERMQDKLDKANNIIATQKAEADNQRQTATLLAAIQAGQQGNGGCCAPAPCCAPNPCTILTNALYTDWVNKTLNPTTTTAAA